MAPLTIGLISDTHMFEDGDRWVADPIVALFHRFQVGLIAHLGDIVGRRIIDQLKEIAPILAVQGNNDEGELTSLPLRWELRVGPHRILLLHGHGGTSARATAALAAPGYDCVVYGHSHRPIIERVGSTLMVNPGSPTDRRFTPHFGIGILNVGVERIEPELLLFNRPEELNRFDPRP